MDVKSKLHVQIKSFPIITGVEVSGLNSQPTETLSDLILYEGKDTNPIQYNSVATTTPDSGTVRGVDLWTLSQWGSERANGNGPQQNYQEEVLSGYHAALPVMAAGDTLDFVPLATNFDMTGLRCPQVKYICNELSKDPRSRPDFEFTAVPDETVLRSCFEVPDGACKGKHLICIFTIIPLKTHQHCISLINSLPPWSSL